MLLVTVLALLTMVQDPATASAAQAPDQIQASATHGQQATTLPEVAVAAQQPEARQVCRREQVTGSNRYRRVCTTEQQRDLRRDTAQRNLDRIRDNNATPESETNPSGN